jgi:glycosyltransferase involved in cell wall biosynthesis
MPKILAINNTIFYESKNKLFLNKETGIFFLRLNELGNDVSVFQISQIRTKKDSFANFLISDKGLKIYEVKRENNRLLAFIKSFFIIQKAILKNDFVYIFYPGPICLIIALLSIIYRKPYGLYVRGEQGIFTNLSIKIFKKAQIIFTISPKFTNLISNYNNNTNTIRPMIALSESDIKTKKSINSDKTVNLLYVGRLVYDKGIFELVDAVKKLIEDNYKVHLNLVGDGTDYEKLKSKVKSQNLQEVVNFTGMISDKNKLIDVYKKSEIFVLPTYHEGFPRVLYEAMIMGIPIVTTFVGSIDYLMKKEINCLEIKVRDIDSIVFALKRLIDKPKLANDLTEKARKTVINYLSDKKRNHEEHLNHFIKTIS